MSQRGEFWDDQLSSIDFSGIGIKRHLSATDREVIRERYEALVGRHTLVGKWPFDLKAIEIRGDITNFAMQLGATPEEIEYDLLKPWGLTQEKPAHQTTRVFQKAKRSGVLVSIKAWLTRVRK